MAPIELEKRDQMAYLALYYAIRGDVDRSEKIRATLRLTNATRKRVHIAARQFVPVV